MIQTQLLSLYICTLVHLSSIYFPSSIFQPVTAFSPHSLTLHSPQFLSLWFFLLLKLILVGILIVSVSISLFLLLSLRYLWICFFFDRLNLHHALPLQSGQPEGEKIANERTNIRNKWANETKEQTKELTYVKTNKRN